ncbi:unnamed protein product [Nezara viridula]|uniref:Uncharacterized protein n=1 Tax=Nezara viridula TaxID=85310 RepID=A0A9P0H6K4_NEZVI|nr:unnamed protein product [Nezara viridula]
MPPHYRLMHSWPTGEHLITVSGNVTCLSFRVQQNQLPDLPYSRRYVPLRWMAYAEPCTQRNYDRLGSR